MMRKRQFAALTLSAALAFGLSLPGLAADYGGEDTPPVLISQQETNPLPDSMLYYGTVAGVQKGENGQITSVHMNSEAKGEMVFQVGESTLYVDAGGHCASDASLLQEGEGLYVFHSPVATLSLPPQTAALVFVGSVPMDAGCPMYHEVEALTDRGGTMVVTTDNGSLELYLDSDTQISAYAEGGATRLAVGSHVMAWYNAVADSMPAQARPSHVLVLPEVEKELPGAIWSNGTRLEEAFRLENGAYMVPVRAVAEALGLEAGYEKADGVQTITVTGEKGTVAAVAGSAEAKYGDQIATLAAEVYIEEPGVTWAPAQLFSLLGITVKAEGQTLYFTA